MQVDNFNFIYYSFSQLLWTPCGFTIKLHVHVHVLPGIE